MTDKVFEIFKIGVKEAEEIASSTNNPHHHDYEELLIGLEGSLDHFIDFVAEDFPAPYISFVTKGKIHRVIPKVKEGKCSVWVIRFVSEFIPETTFRLYSFFHENANIVMPAGSCFDRLVRICEIMQAETNQEQVDYGVIRHLLNALFTMIESERRKITGPDDTIRKTQNITFRNFLLILEENFRRPLGVEFYAEKLFMSSRNLNIICNNILQQSVSEIIETRKLTEAKNLLITTDKSISEISYELGYNEKSYFSNVFKKKSGLTPGDFREEMKKIIS
jgi:AraC-like DNA-binding protein